MNISLYAALGLPEKSRNIFTLKSVLLSRRWKIRSVPILSGFYVTYIYFSFKALDFQFMTDTCDYVDKKF